MRLPEAALIPFIVSTILWASCSPDSGGTSQLPEECADSPYPSPVQEQIALSPCYSPPDFQGFSSTQVSLRSFRIFVASLWPVVHGKNGVPNLETAPGTGPGGDNRSVWETWRTTDEIFREGKPPLPWKAPHSLHTADKCKTVYDAQLSNLKKEYPGVDSRNIRNLNMVKDPQALLMLRKKFSVMGKGEVKDETTPSDFTLRDRNGNRVYYEVALNRTAYDYIVKNRLYSKAGLDTFLAGSSSCEAQCKQYDCNPNGPVDVCPDISGLVKANCSQSCVDLCESNLQFPGGNDDAEKGERHQTSVVVKAAWRILTPRDDPSRFHKSFALLPADKERGDLCGNVSLVGLVGIHIGYMSTLNRKTLRWSWSTFEQIDNSPAPGAPVQEGDRTKWSFNAPYYFDQVDKSNPVRQIPIGKRDGCPAAPGVHYWALPLSIVKEAASTPVTQTDRSINTPYRNLFQKTSPSSVWQYYEENNTQWWDMTDAQGALQNRFLANTSIEPFVQNVSSCDQCHRTARTAVQGKSVPVDSLFIFQNAR